MLLLGSCKQVSKKSPSQGETRQISQGTEASREGDGAVAKSDPVKNYWKEFNFADTTLIHCPQISERAFAGYAELLRQLPAGEAGKEIQQMMRKAGTGRQMFAYFAALCQKYLHDPNSPLRDEEIYISALEAILASEEMDDIHKERYRHQYKIALRNRQGAKAADLAYTLTSGRKGNLYSIKADFTLIYFNNPECHDCAVVMKKLTQSALINKMLATGRLRILAFYPDRELDIWKKHCKDYPHTWINGHDTSGEGIREREVYDLKAIPSLYLLDKKKQVLLRDAFFEEVEQVLGADTTGSTIKKESHGNSKG